MRNQTDNDKICYCVISNQIIESECELMGELSIWFIKPSSIAI